MPLYYLPSENIKDFWGRFVDVVLDNAGLIMDWCVEENKKAKLFAWGKS
jgi:hypothetical protein